jgi:hypothetical protein
MVNFVNGLLMLGFIIILYLSVKKYNKEKMKDFNNRVHLDDTTIDSHMEVCDDIFEVDTPYIETEFIKFENNPTKEVINQFQKEQKYGSNMAVKYPNKYAVKLDEKDNITYGDWKDLSGNPDDFLDTKVVYNEDLYKPTIANADGRLDPNDPIMAGKSIREIYDDSILDFKSLIIKKNKMKTLDGPREFKQTGASKLSYNMEDDWVYENEKPENGGEILDGFFASDPMVNNTPAIF